VEKVPTKSQKESAPKFCRGKVVPPNLKKNPLLNSVEAVPATSQKESTPKFCGGSFHKSKKESPQNSVEVHSYNQISKRFHPQILWRQFPPKPKKNPPQNYDGSCNN
jgi:hypothetical protein